MQPILRKHVATAMMLLAPFGAALVAQPAAAQHAPSHRVAQAEQGRITTLSLNSDAGLSPGATLRVHAYGTPDARSASVTLGSSGVRIALRERARGEYVGTHVVRRGDRIDPRQAMTVRASWGHGSVAVVFDYPASFQALAMGGAPAVAAVSAFTMSPSDGLAPGEVVRFRVEGTPRARAFVRIPEVARTVALREVRPGVYVGSYTVRRRDDASAFAEARAVLRTGNQQVVARVSNAARYGFYGR